MCIRDRVQATFNIPTELEAAYNRGVAGGKAILDAWDKYIEGVDKAAVKRARELKDRLATEAATREQAYTDVYKRQGQDRVCRLAARPSERRGPRPLALHGQGPHQQPSD